jgi:hypothetical protein
LLTLLLLELRFELQTQELQILEQIHHHMDYVVLLVVLLVHNLQA